MHKQPFYVTLPSDASMQQFPDNSSAQWSTKLKTPISLSGKWEVAMVEFQYMNSLYTISQAQDLIVNQMVQVYQEVPQQAVLQKTSSEPTPAGLTVTMKKPEAATQYKYKLESSVIRFEPGNYKPEDFINKLVSGSPELLPVETDNKEVDILENSTKQKAFKAELYSHADHWLRFNFPSRRVSIYFPPQSIALQKILGIDQNVIAAGLSQETNFEDYYQEVADLFGGKPYERHFGGTFVGSRPLNPLLGNQSLYVYSDIVDFSLLGDTAAQILRSVSIKGEFMSLVTERFDIPHYVPVATNHFETITIGISTDLEDNAKFASGKSLVKLHFRPQRLF